jgi:hypothetical protein
VSAQCDRLSSPGAPSPTLPLRQSSGMGMDTTSATGKCGAWSATAALAEHRNAGPKGTETRGPTARATTRAGATLGIATCQCGAVRSWGSAGRPAGCRRASARGRRNQLRLAATTGHPSAASLMRNQNEKMMSKADLAALRRGAILMNFFLGLHFWAQSPTCQIFHAKLSLWRSAERGLREPETRLLANVVQETSP